MSIGENTPFGFLPSEISSTGNSTFNTQTYNINPSNTTAIGIGDLVAFDSDGYIRQATTSDNVIVGSFAGIDYTGTNQPVILSQPNYWTGNANGQTNIVAKVWVSPTYLFMAQLSGAGVTQANLGTSPYCDLVVGVPNSTSGQSTYTVDSGSFTGTKGTLPLKFIGLASVSNGATQNAYGLQYNVGLFALMTPYISI